MDLDLVKLRLCKGFYASAEEVCKDVQRVWDNAYAFNPNGSIVFRCVGARRLGLWGT